MRERFTLPDLKKLAAAHTALRVANETIVARQQVEYHQQNERVQDAREALSESCAFWEGALRRNLDPALLRLQAADIPRRTTAIENAEKTLREIERRLDAGRLALAQATVRDRLSAARTTRLRKVMARRAEERRMQGWEDVVTRRWSDQ